MIIDHGEQPLDLPDPSVKGGSVVWLLGRGLSISCGLKWTEPAEWKLLPRRERVEKIKPALRAEMDSPHVDRTPIREFLNLLDQHTAPGWQHLFVTTNWDYLLQQELTAMVHRMRVAPPWLHYGAGSHVHHVNGTVEPATQHRSCFMLDDDLGNERSETTEANYAFNYLQSERTFVLVGMSFECNTDRYLLRQLNKVEDWMPIGESHWTIVNPDREASEAVCRRIREALPAAQVEPPVTDTFADWLTAGCPCLKAKGVFRD